VLSLTIIDALRQHAKQKPDITAITYLVDGEELTQTITFMELNARAQDIAVSLREKSPGAERALIVHEPGLDFVLALCACFYAGVAAIPTPPPAFRVNSRSAQRFGRLIKDADPDIILTHSELFSKLTWFTHEQAGLIYRNWVCTDAVLECGDNKLNKIDVEDLALIQYTSGSTSAPKGVLVSHGNLAANLAAIAEKFSLNGDSCVVNWLPPYHDMGLIGGIIEAIWSGYHLILMDPKHFAQRPLRWLQAIDRFQADVSGGANFAYDLCVDAAAKSPPSPDLDLSQWRLAFNGAEPVRERSVHRFAERFAGNGFQLKAFYPTYGMAEATLMATGPEPGSKRPGFLRINSEALSQGRATPIDNPPNEAELGISNLVSCGSPCLDTDLVIVDPDQQRVCAPGDVGEIWLAGPAVSKGYWSAKSSGTENQLQSLPGENEHRFLPTGDLGFLWDGELFITGRHKDLIIIRGKNHTPHDIEEVAAISHPALVHNGAAAFSIEVNDSEELVVVCEVRREARRTTDWPETLGAIYKKVSEYSALSAYDVVLLKPGALPRTTSGKLQRHACRRAYMDGIWDPLARLKTADLSSSLTASENSPGYSMNTPGERLTQLDEYLCHQLAKLTSSSPVFVQPNTNLFAAGLDSLKRIEFALLIEQELNLSLPAGLLEQDLTVAELASMIRAKTSAVGVIQIDDPEEIPVQMSGTVPMTPMQQRYLSNAKNPEKFVETVFLRTPVNLDLAALRAALTALDRYHDAFSLRFHQDGSAWSQTYGQSETGIKFDLIDASNQKKDQFVALRTTVLDRLKSEINLKTGPIAKAILLDRGVGQRGLLVIGFHHLVIDAISVSIWITQFQSAYLNACRGSPPLTRPAVPRFGPWLKRLHDHASSDSVTGQIDYWRSACGPAREATGISVGNGRAKDGKVPVFKRVAKTSLSPSQNKQLLQRFTTGAERNCLFLSAFAWAWKEVTGENSLLVMLENHGRLPLSGTDPLSAIGWFTNRYPMRIPVSSAHDPETLFRVVFAQFESVPDLGVGYQLLTQGMSGVVAKEGMASLQKPAVSLQYRGNIDDAFRSDAPFPVIGVTHGRAEELDDQVVVNLMAGLSDGIAFWTLGYRPPFDQSMGRNLSENIYGFLCKLINED